MSSEIIPQISVNGPASDAPASRAEVARSSHIPPRLLFGAGMLAAVLLAEFALRPFTSALDNEWDSLAAEQASSHAREVRRFTEGIATSHFSRSRARLTGNPPIESAPIGVILGDSYVEAVQVSDEETMGSALERALRATGQDINVRQYGWPGVDIPQYVSVARDLIRLWDPVWVVVVITANDLGPGISGLLVHPVNDPSRDPRTVTDLKQEPTTWIHRLTGIVLGHSVLVYHLLKRAQEAGLRLPGTAHARDNAGPASLQPGGLPLPQRTHVALTALRESYGDRLRILFIADVGVDGRQGQSPAERSVLAACATLHIRCADTRALMSRDRRDSLRVSRGFINSTPGAGHINAVGHALAAETIRRELLMPLTALGVPKN